MTVLGLAPVGHELAPWLAGLILIGVVGWTANAAKGKARSEQMRLVVRMAAVALIALFAIFRG